MIYFKLWVLYFHIRNPCAHMLPNMLPIAYEKWVSKIARYYRMSWESWVFPLQYQDFLHLKSNFPHIKSDFPCTKSDLPKSAFYFLQQLSAFFNGFLTFFNGFPNFSNGFPIFLKGFPLSEKSEKIFLWQEVYERLLFELCIFCYSLPKLCDYR
jgi:hypothetical protein